MFTFEIGNTAHLFEPFSIRLKASLYLLTSHSRFQFDRILSQDGLVTLFALRRRMPIPNVLPEPQADGNCHCGCNDHEQLHSLSAHSLIIALT